MNDTNKVILEAMREFDQVAERHHPAVAASAMGSIIATYFVQNFCPTHREKAFDDWVKTMRIGMAEIEKNISMGPAQGRA